MSFIMKQIVRFITCCLLLGVSVVRAETVMVATAANFATPMKEITAAFEKQSGHTVLLTFGSSGKFFAQIQNGAPFDLFLSADAAKPRKLEKLGWSVPGSRFTYAQGSLVLWSAQEGLVAADSPDILRSGSIRHLALANPKLAPYGAAAVETLTRLGVYDTLSPKLVQGENIAQAYQYVFSGNAELGFVALSQVMQDGQLSAGSGWVVPADLYTPIRQDAVLLTRGKDNSAAIALLDYLRSDAAAVIIHAYGYKL